MTDSRLTLRTETGPGYVLVALSGQCDGATGAQFREGLANEVARGALRMVVDLSGLEFIDSTGVHVLLELKDVLTGWGGSLVLVSPQPIVARILSLMGADELIPVTATVAEALALSLVSGRSPGPGRFLAVFSPRAPRVA